MTSGTNNFTWIFTARHATTSYRYFITKPDWNPNAPLTRAQFDLTPFCTINGNGQQPPATLTHTCNVPQREGYNVILGVWDIADTQNAWYIVIDAQFGPGDSIAPTAPTNLAVSNVGTTTAKLTWGPRRTTMPSRVMRCTTVSMSSPPYLPIRRAPISPIYWQARLIT